MQIKSLKGQKKVFFKKHSNSVPIIGGSDKISKQVIMRATKSKSINKLTNISINPVKKVVVKKQGLKKKLLNAGKIGIGAIAVATAMNLVNKSITRARIDELARASELRAKQVMVLKDGSVKYPNKYPKITPAQATKEMSQVRQILKLNMASEADVRIANNLFEVAMKAGVSPRIALRTIARSSGKSSALNPEINRLENILIEQEKLKNYEGAKRVDEKLKKIKKIKLILETLESMNSKESKELKLRAWNN